LLAGAPSKRERKRLEQLQMEHAGAWLSAVPSALDGPDTLMKPRCFEVSVAVRLGIPVVGEEKSCSSCEQKFDILGDHASCCSKTADLVHRHNRLRNLVDKICVEGMLAPAMEKRNSGRGLWQETGGCIGPSLGRGKRARDGRGGHMSNAQNQYLGGGSL
jgi:hypothetical protein